MNITLSQPFIAVYECDEYAMDVMKTPALWIWCHWHSTWCSGKNLPVHSGDAGDAGSIHGSGRSPGGGNGNPLRYSCLENPHGQRSLVGSIHGVAKSWTWLSVHAGTCKRQLTHNQTQESVGCFWCSLMKGVSAACLPRVWSEGAVTDQEGHPDSCLSKALCLESCPRDLRSSGVGLIPQQLVPGRKSCPFVSQFYKSPFSLCVKSCFAVPVVGSKSFLFLWSTNVICLYLVIFLRKSFLIGG